MNLEELLDPGTLVLLVGGVIAVVAIVGHYLNDYAKNRAEREIKMMMLQQGKSVQDIERVLRAGKGKDEEASGASERGQTT